MFILGSTVSSNNLLSDIAHPYMTRLAEISQENINLAILFEKKALYLKVFLKTIELVPYTKKTIIDPKVLLRIIRNVKKKGYATDLEELSEEIHCIGAPIRDHTNKVIAAISISAPAVRLTIQKMEKLKGSLMEASLQISKKLGYTETKTTVKGAN